MLYHALFTINLHLLSLAISCDFPERWNITAAVIILKGGQKNDVMSKQLHLNLQCFQGNTIQLPLWFNQKYYNSKNARQVSRMTIRNEFIFFLWTSTSTHGYHNLVFSFCIIYNYLWCFWKFFVSSFTLSIFNRVFSIVAFGC